MSELRRVRRSARIPCFHDVREIYEFMCMCVCTYRRNRPFEGMYDIAVLLVAGNVNRFRYTRADFEISKISKFFYVFSVSTISYQIDARTSSDDLPGHFENPIDATAPPRRGPRENRDQSSLRLAYGSVRFRRRNTFTFYRYTRGRHAAFVGGRRPRSERLRSSKMYWWGGVCVCVCGRARDETRLRSTAGNDDERGNSTFRSDARRTIVKRKDNNHPSHGYPFTGKRYSYTSIG